MNYLDIFFVLIFIFGAVKGFIKGFIVELFSFLAFFIGLFVAIELTIPVSNYFFSDNNYFQLLTVGMFIALFLLMVVGINLVAKVIKKAVDLTFIGLFDNIFGSIASVFKWSFIISVVFWVFDSIGLRLPVAQTDGSMVYPLVKNVGPSTFQWLSEMLPFIQDMIDSLKDIGDKRRSVYTFL